MPHRKIVLDAIASFKSTLDEAIEAAQSLTLEPMFELNFNTSQITEDWIEGKLKNLRTGYAKSDKKKCVLYIFKLANKGNSEVIFKEILRYKKERKADEKKSNLCTLNIDFFDSTTLYVGRSFTPKSRIHQHLNSSETGTYAMHLQQWATDLALALQLKIYEVPEYRDIATLERGMNVLETGLWDHLRPLLGRRGDK